MIIRTRYPLARQNTSQRFACGDETTQISRMQS